MTSKRAFGCVIGAAVALFGSVGNAAAHANFVRSEPAAGAAVPEAPQAISVWFSQLVERGEHSRLEVFAVDGTQVDAFDSSLREDDSHALRVSVPTLSPGAYTVRWHTRSAEDGEEAHGEFAFGVGDVLLEPPPALPAEEHQHATYGADAEQPVPADHGEHGH